MLSRFSYELLHRYDKGIDTFCHKEKEESKRLKEILKNVEDFRDIYPGFYPLQKWEDHGKDEYGGALLILYLESEFEVTKKVRAPLALAEEVKANIPGPRFIWKHGMCENKRGAPVHGFSVVC